MNLKHTISAIFLVACGGVQAAPVTIEFGGFIYDNLLVECLETSATGYCTDQEFHHPRSSSDFAPGLNVTVGDSFKGSFTYDSEASLTSSFTGTTSDFVSNTYSDAVTNLVFELSGGYSFPNTFFPSVTYSSSTVYDGEPTETLPDRFRIQQHSSLSNDWALYFSLELTGTDSSFLDTPDLPSVLSLDLFPRDDVGISFSDPESNALILKGRLTSLGPAVTAVPLPASVWLMGSALVGFVAVRRRRKSLED